jgi:hypothetical protein
MIHTTTFKKVAICCLIFRASLAHSECPTETRCIAGKCERVPISTCQESSNVRVIRAPSTLLGDGNSIPDATSAASQPKLISQSESTAPKPPIAKKRPEKDQTKVPPRFNCALNLAESPSTGSSYFSGGASPTGDTSGRHQIGKAVLSGLGSVFGPTVEESLAIVVRNGNKQFPQMVSEGLRGDSASSGPGKLLTYNYTVLLESTCRNLRSTTDAFRQRFCANKQMALFISKGVTVAYVYHDPTGLEQFRVTIEPGQCR